MAEAIFVEGCTPPDSQGLLFVIPAGRPCRFVVLDRRGTAHLRTGTLGVALSAAKHLASVDGDAWIANDDGTSARIQLATVESATPQQPWVRTVACALQRKEPTP